MSTYFAADGSYGCSKGLSVVDTSQWTDEDWRRIDDASDGNRVDIAREIHRGPLACSHEGGRCAALACPN